MYVPCAFTTQLHHLCTDVRIEQEIRAYLLVREEFCLRVSHFSFSISDFPEVQIISRLQGKAKVCFADNSAELVLHRALAITQMAIGWYTVWKDS